MQDLIRLRNANVTLWNHMNQPKTGPEVPIGHDHTFPIITNLVDTMQEMQDEAAKLLQLQVQHDNALEVEQKALEEKQHLIDHHAKMKAEPVMVKNDDGEEEDPDYTQALEDAGAEAEEANTVFQKLHTVRAEIGDQLIALKKRLAGKLAPAILQIDLIAASTGIELHAAVPSFFNSFAKEHGLVGVEV